MVGGHSGPCQNLAHGESLGPAFAAAQERTERPALPFSHGRLIVSSSGAGRLPGAKPSPNALDPGSETLGRPNPETRLAVSAACSHAGREDSPPPTPRPDSRGTSVARGDRASGAGGLRRGAGRPSPERRSATVARIGGIRRVGDGPRIASRVGTRNDPETGERQCSGSQQWIAPGLCGCTTSVGHQKSARRQVSRTAPQQPPEIPPPDAVRLTCEARDAVGQGMSRRALVRLSAKR
jgi:hypothetical protein